LSAAAVDAVAAKPTMAVTAAATTERLTLMESMVSGLSILVSIAGCNGTVRPGGLTLRTAWGLKGARAGHDGAA